MAGFFSFPNPVNETSARVVASGVVAMAATAVVTDQLWLTVPLTYGFAARVATGPKLSPLGRIATEVVTPHIRAQHKFSTGPPKRMAQAMGLAMSSSALLLNYRYRRSGAAKVVLTVLMGAAGLEAGMGLCLGCKLFQLGMRVGLVPPEVCQDCNDIWSRYP